MKRNISAICSCVAAVVVMMMALPLSSCSDDSAGTSQPEVTGKEYTVAVVLPGSGGLERQWKNVLQLFDANLHKAVQGDGHALHFKYEWFDEETADIATLARELSQRDDVVAVIGGLYSEKASLLEAQLCRFGKPFFTLATTEELIRKYAGKGNLWAMTETDITQSEVLLSKASMYGAKSVALIARDNDPYGKTFIDWLPFQARELGLDVTGVATYTDNVYEATCTACAGGPDFIICTPSSVDDVGVILQASFDYAVEHGTAPRMLFSDVGYGNDVLEKLGSKAAGLEGVCFSSDPTSGFDVSYDTYFGEPPLRGAAHLYDAAMLLAYGLYYRELNPDLTLTQALRYIVDGTETMTGSWMDADMRQVFGMLRQGHHPDIRGASGRLNFDKKVYTNVVNTVYCNYLVYEGKYLVLDYNSTDGSNRTDATLAGWNWKAEQLQEFERGESHITYPELHDRKALIVAGSSTWINYRHQADALNMYHILRQCGYDDDHIILILEDDIAHNSNNSQPGVIQVTPGGENLYRDVVIDYKTSDLHPGDLYDIILGNPSERFPQTLGSGENDNVLVFWSGHGAPGYLDWLDEEEFTAATARRIFEDAYSRKKYRKMLWLVETCYSGSVGNQCEGIPGVLCFTAANDMESSKADVWSSDLGVWMSNRFTATMHDCIASNPDITLRDLYYRMFISTVGSHVMVYNASNYGNLYLETMREFLQ